jgi:hypothetical protein
VYRHQPKDIATFGDDEFFGIRPEEVPGCIHHPSWVYGSVGGLCSVTFGTQKNIRFISCVVCNRNILLGQLTERDCAAPSEVFVAEDEIRSTFALYPKIIENTETLLAGCSIRMASDIIIGSTLLPMGKATISCWLLARTGCVRRYGRHNEDARQAGRVGA